MKPVLSIIIPVLNEEKNINSTLSALCSLDGFDFAEVIVSDGDPEGSTLSVIVHDHVHKVLSTKGRGIQMTTGAKHAQGNIFLFLHADTRLPENALRLILNLHHDRNLAGGAFDLGIDAPGLAFRIIEKAASFRSRFTRMPYGDQALFITRKWYYKIGGFKPLPIMEDIDMMRRLKHHGGRIRIFPDRVSTSARRWHDEGLWACTLRNWFLLLSYLIGINPKKLSKYY